MNWSMTSEHLQLLIAGYVLGDLDVNEATEFEQIVNAHPAIAEEVDRMQRALELAFAPPEIQPPAHLRSTILAALDPQTMVKPTVATQTDLKPTDSQSTASQSTIATPRNPLHGFFPWSLALHIVAIVLIAALVTNNYRLRQALPASHTETQRLATLVYALQATAEGSTASATVAVDPNRLEARLTVQNLPSLPPGKVYVLWTVVRQDAPVTRDDKNAILTNVFNVDAQGRAAQSIAVPSVYRSPDWVSNLAVTIEDVAAPQNHQGKPVMIVNL